MSGRFPVGPLMAVLTLPLPRQGEAVTAALEWLPSPPRRLSRAELRQYRRGRSRALAALGKRLGRGKLAVVEL